MEVQVEASGSGEPALLSESTTAAPRAALGAAYRVYSSIRVEGRYPTGPFWEIRTAVGPSQRASKHARMEHHQKRFLVSA